MSDSPAFAAKSDAEPRQQARNALDHPLAGDPLANADREAERARVMASHPEVEQARAILDALPDIVFLLNEDLRIVAFNQQFPRILKAACADPVGMRFGELIACAHAGARGHGCGHSRDCESCGAFLALTASRNGAAGAQECALLSASSERLDIVELRVQTRSIRIGDQPLSMLSAQDITDERRRRTMEKIFFSESMTIAERLRAGLARLNAVSPPDMTEDVRLIRTMFDNMVEKIEAQKELLAAENDELQPRMESHATDEVVRQIEAAYRSHERARDKRLTCELEAFDLVTDVRLLRRILGNMTKNALEASRSGDEIVLRCARVVRNGCPTARFEVSNPETMPRSVQLQIFNRSFSTKSAHRGLGTYSMKLLSTRYLQGDVGFRSIPGEGTTFFLEVPVFPVASATARAGGLDAGLGGPGGSGGPRGNA